MRKSFGLLIAILSLVILGVVGVFVLRPPEPIYNGQPVTFWINQGYIPQADARAVPYLVKALRTRKGAFQDSYVKFRSAVPAWVRRHLTRPPNIEAWLVRLTAATELGRVGTNSPAAIAGLLRVLKNDDSSIVRVAAAESLQQIGKGNQKVERAIVEALHDQAPEVRDAAADALWQLDPVTAKSLLK